MSIKPCVASRAKGLRYPNRLSFSHANPQVSNLDKGMCLRCTSTHSVVLLSNDSTDKINSDLGTVALARPTSHTGCTQALWCEIGVRNGGCDVAYMCRGSATAASRSLQERSESGRISQEMSWPAPETGDFVPCPRYALFGSLMKAKKKNWPLHMILIVTPSVARWVHLHVPQLRFFFFMLCTHSRMLYLCKHSPQTAPITHTPRLAQPCASLQCACACLFPLNCLVVASQFACRFHSGLLFPP